MEEIMYKPEDAGNIVINSRGKKTKLRKYHMTEKDIERTKEKWTELVKTIDSKITKKAGKYFFNPYRKGIYYYQIQAMYLLGCNDWHSLEKIVEKMKEIMSEVIVKKEGIILNSWERFRNKTSRTDAIRCKDYVGRIQENMLFFQRLGKLHPAGYKLRQVYSAVDIKRVSKEGFINGLYYYRLSTYNNFEKALPYRDFSDFEFPLSESKFINRKFIGTIVTKNNIMSGGEINEMSSMQSGKY